MEPVSKSAFLHDLRVRVQGHSETVTTVFKPLDEGQLIWPSNGGAWSILQCFDHLNLTHEYYMPRIDKALSNPRLAVPDEDTYRPSFWGRIYMYFAHNPKYSFPTAGEITPGSTLSPDVLDTYLAKQQALSQILGQVDDVDLGKTPVPLEKRIKFNLGDCLKVLVYHDELHIGQARGVLAASVCGQG